MGLSGCVGDVCVSGIVLRTGLGDDKSGVLSHLRIEGDHHHIMRVTLKKGRVVPVGLPVPELDRTIITGGDDIWQGGVNVNGTNVISVSLEALRNRSGKGGSEFPKRQRNQQKKTEP